jgi:hypothetical protein
MPNTNGMEPAPPRANWRGDGSTVTGLRLVLAGDDVLLREGWPVCFSVPATRYSRFQASGRVRLKLAVEA